MPPLLDDQGRRIETNHMQHNLLPVWTLLSSEYYHTEIVHAIDEDNQRRLDANAYFKGIIYMYKPVAHGSLYPPWYLSPHDLMTSWPHRHGLWFVRVMRKRDRAANPTQTCPCNTTYPELFEIATATWLYFQNMVLFSPTRIFLVQKSSNLKLEHIDRTIFIEKPPSTQKIANSKHGGISKWKPLAKGWLERASQNLYT